MEIDHSANPRSGEHSQCGSDEHDQRNRRHTEIEVIDQYPQSEREEDLLPGTIEQAQVVIESVFLAENDTLSLLFDFQDFAVVHIRKSEHQYRRDQRHQSAHNEHRFEIEYFVTEHEEYDRHRDQGAGLVYGSQPAEHRAGFRLRGQAHPQRCLRLQPRVVTHGRDDDPRSYSPETGSESEEPIPNRQKHHGECCEMRQRETVEQGCQEDEEEPRNLADSRDVTKLRTF